MSDIHEISIQIAQFLIRFLPDLLKGTKLAGKAAAGKLGEEITEESVQQAKDLWKKLRGNEAVMSSARKVEIDPEDAENRAAFAKEIALALREDKTLFTEARRIVSEVKVGDVKKGGKVTGVRGKMPKGGVSVESRVETGDISGEVTGVDLEG